MGSTPEIESEGALIAYLKKCCASTQPPALSLGIGDDAAVFGSGDPRWIITQDALIEETHFLRRSISPEDLAYKAIAVNLSDLAAMGARPLFLMLSLEVPKNLPPTFLTRLLRAFTTTAKRLGLSLIGGNTASGKALAMHVTAIGQAPKRNILYRSGARAGDRIYTSGPLGGAALGLHFLLHNSTNFSVKLHTRPPIRTALGIALGHHHFAHSATDVSDGLLRDLRDLTPPALKATLFAEKIPIAPRVQKTATELGLDPLALALGGGEDYELLFSVPQKKESAFLAWCKKTKTPAHGIGYFEKKNRGDESINALDKRKNPLVLDRYKNGYEAKFY